MFRHALVTGASGAIGSALSRALRPRCATMSLVDVDVARLSPLARELDARAHTWDLADVHSLEPHWDEATADTRVDLLINCAGILDFRSVDAMPWDDARRVLDVDLVAPLWLQRRAAAEMSRGGAIVNVASLAGVVPLRGATYYGAAKAGLAMASEIAHVELAPRGIHVVTVYPGPVRSGLERKGRTQLAESALARVLPSGSPDVLAARIVRALDRRSARVVYPFPYDLAPRFPSVASAITRRFSPAPLS
jgi:short-subunit dehydrogenase